MIKLWKVSYCTLGVHGIFDFHIFFLLITCRDDHVLKESISFDAKTVVSDLTAACEAQFTEKFCTELTRKLKESGVMLVFLTTKNTLGRFLRKELIDISTDL